MNVEEKIESSAALNGNVTATEKRCLNFDLDPLLAADGDLPSDELVIEPTTRRILRPEKREKFTHDNSSAGAVSFGGAEDFSRMSDAELASNMERRLRHIKAFGVKLADKGAELRSLVRLSQDELERVKRRRDKQDDVV